MHYIPVSYIYSPKADVLHIQNNHGTQGRLVGMMVSYRLLTNRWRLDWLASGGHFTLKPQNFHLKKHG